MDIQGITTSQILTVSLFLVGLIFLQIFITKNKNKFSSKWRTNKRIQIIEEKALSTTEKIKIISIDNYEFLMISNKGKKSSLLPFSDIPSRSEKKTLPISKRNNTIKSEPKLNFSKLKANNQNRDSSPNEHQLSQAIQVARKMNPAVSYKS